MEIPTIWWLVEGDPAERALMTLFCTANLARKSRDREDFTLAQWEAVASLF